MTIVVRPEGNLLEPQGSSPLSVPPGRGSVWDFLARACLALETPGKGGWISLDFLGFSRVKRDLSMGYAGFSLKNFSSGFRPLGVRSAGTEGGRRGDGEARNCPSSKLTWFPIFCNQFSSPAISPKQPPSMSRSAREKLNRPDRFRPFAAPRDRRYERAGSAGKRSSAESVGSASSGQSTVARRGGCDVLRRNSE